MAASAIARATVNRPRARVSRISPLIDPRPRHQAVTAASSPPRLRFMCVPSLRALPFPVDARHGATAATDDTARATGGPVELPRVAVARRRSHDGHLLVPGRGPYPGTGTACREGCPASLRTPLSVATDSPLSCTATPIVHMANIVSQLLGHMDCPRGHHKVNACSTELLHARGYGSADGRPVQKLPRGKTTLCGEEGEGIQRGAGAPGRTRTRSLLVRSQALCPVELRGRPQSQCNIRPRRQ